MSRPILFESIHIVLNFIVYKNEYSLQETYL